MRTLLVVAVLAVVACSPKTTPLSGKAEAQGSSANAVPTSTKVVPLAGTATAVGGSKTKSKK